jgi:hypothetical protein
MDYTCHRCGFYYCTNMGGTLREALNAWADMDHPKVYYDPCQTCCPFGYGECQGHLILEGDA